MRINHNIAALNTYRQLNTASTAQSKSMEKLSSGLRINKAGDDAAGLAISEKMRGQIRGLDMASKNSQDGISMVQTAEGALNETHDILQRMRELATQAANDTNTTDDRGEIQKEINQLTSEINRIGNTTEFNTKKLLNGGTGGAGGTGGKVAAEMTSTLASTNDMTSADATLDITIDGKKYSLDKTAVNSMGDMTDTTKILDALKGAKDADGKAITDAADISITSGKLTITSKTAGSDSQVKIETGGTDAAKLATDLGITSGDEEKGLDAPSAGTITGTLASTNDMTSADATLDITIDGKKYSLDKTAV
ncbi:flagellin N-terminal helical domain-containing protein, partial [Niallia sp. HCP3S3_B10]|uniref:flagellin N-terminal helical domain-containing protein n=1 Tax=Niallia sp. HCP3S3_B10 TaxID=3438944 RepID=UPI003F8A26B7